ncbi:glycerophosphocholine acyltransferase NDAI_0H00540 [Naumovozyma dairenensis CBS 421]|uniref:Glycerophosphocholine acyltransferase 1 n=1 Tax=Naumovozyma dairenensis (strain ATCC 10597 / BCRC 20456 / CBS 421 / NBRC 0211 / NRRL Y-12639) TaxID=1071378 RepID=G0WEL7_NAUDC|nr:hypothetical protein NDAI_0H00540 [Naumovozyma dairenensis CBS 421]CCD26228.1 hypothetical protein NDAI_0H00540 [Naumovozyma dairenensis CBS 421]
MLEVDLNIKEDSTVSLMNILEFLDPIASKVSTRYYQGHKRVLSRNDLREKIRNGNKKLSELTSKEKVEEWKLKVLERIKHLDKTLDSIFFKNSSTLEKAFYPFTLFNILSIGFIMGKFPEWFHVYYTLVLFFLMPIRFYTYYKIQSHYYLADLCYFVNFLCLLFIWQFPESTSLFQSCFAFTFGSLAWAVLTWRNSLVIHSIDKTTSCFIHIIPPTAMYVIFYGIKDSYREERFPGAMASKTSISMKSNIIWTSFYYLIWQILYHYFITFKKSSKIKSGQRMTSFEYLTTHQFKDFWAAKLPSPIPMIIYTILQYFYQLFTMLLCSIWIRYKKLALFFLMSIFLIAAHNGATYYIDYYGKTFKKEVDKLKIELELLQQELNDKNIQINYLNIELDKESSNSIITTGSTTSIAGSYTD